MPGAPEIAELTEAAHPGIQTLGVVHQLPLGLEFVSCIAAVRGMDQQHTDGLIIRMGSYYLLPLLNRRLLGFGGQIADCVVKGHRYLYYLRLIGPRPALRQGKVGKGGQYVIGRKGGVVAVAGSIQHGNQFRRKGQVARPEADRILLRHIPVEKLLAHPHLAIHSDLLLRYIRAEIDLRTPSRSLIELEGMGHRVRADLVSPAGQLSKRLLIVRHRIVGDVHPIFVVFGIDEKCGPGAELLGQRSILQRIDKGCLGIHIVRQQQGRRPGLGNGALVHSPRNRIFVQRLYQQHHHIHRRFHRVHKRALCLVIAAGLRQQHRLGETEPEVIHHSAAVIIAQHSRASVLKVGQHFRHSVGLGPVRPDDLLVDLLLSVTQRDFSFPRVIDIGKGRLSAYILFGKA